MNKPKKDLMKHLFLSLLAVIFFTSCEDELDKLTMFNVSNSTTFSIPATTIINTPLAINTPEIESNSNNDFSNNNSRKDLIESAKLTQLRLRVDAPNNGDFDFLNEIELFIDADGVEETLLASLKNISTNQQEIELESSGEELAPYLRADNYSIRVRAITDETISEEYTINADFTFFIDAEILGI